MRDFLNVCLDMEKLQPLFCCQALVVLDLHLPVLFVLHVPAYVSLPTIRSVLEELSFSRKYFALGSHKLGLSLELGSFVAGVMISTTDFAQHTLDQ
ncbi:hypothetical protein Droror1_Dr00005236, partial [Drosera rotundifolia]